MNVTLYRPAPNGTVAAPPSKSHVHRALICASAAAGRSRITCGGTSEDTEATAGCLRALGTDITYINGTYVIEPGSCSGGLRPAVLRCGESGSTVRFLIPYALVMGRESVFVMEGRLPDRPLDPLLDTLAKHGGRFYRPVRNRLIACGKIGPGEYEIDGSLSSQFVSGLMMALGAVGGRSVIRVTGNEASKPYIGLTARTLKQFGADVTEDGPVIRIEGTGYRPSNVLAEGDWSNAAVFLCAGAVSGGEVTVTGLDTGSVQGDREILDILKAAGAQVKADGDSVTVSGGNMTGFEADAGDIPDLVPVMAVLAASCHGTSVISGCSRLRLKESDRIESVCSMIESLGGTVSENDGIITVNGTGSLRGGTVGSRGDHRIAMAAAAAACICGDKVTIEGAEVVSKSFPGFWDELGRLCE